GGLVVNTLPSLPSIVINQPATFDIGPHLDEYDAFNFVRSGSRQTMYKVWGESAVNKSPFPMIPVSAGAFVNSLATRNTDSNAALLWTFQHNTDATGAYAIELPLAG